MAKGKIKKKSTVSLVPFIVVAIVITIVIAVVFVVPNLMTQDIEVDIPVSIDDSIDYDPETVKRYTFKMKWDFVPIMSIEGPAWIDVSVYTSAGVFVDSVSMADENVWYDSINKHAFFHGEVVRIVVTFDNGWDFLIDNLPDGDVMLIAGNPAYEFDLYAGGDDWGNLWFEWVEI